MSHADASHGAVMRGSVLFVLGFGTFNMGSAGLTYAILAAAACNSELTCSGNRGTLVIAWMVLTELWAVAMALLIDALTKKRRSAPERVAPKLAARAPSGPTATKDPKELDRSSSTLTTWISLYR